MNIISLDFETYCDLDLRKVGLYRYVRHSSFEILCLAWSINFDEPELWTPKTPVPEELSSTINNPNFFIYAFNAAFEREIIKHCYKQLKLNSPPRLSRYRDTMAIACTYSYPQSLDKAAKAAKIKHLKDKRGNYLINKLCKPKKWSKATPFTRWTPENAPQDFEDLYEYCRQDVRAEQSLLRFLPRQELSFFEQKVWQHTVLQNDRGINIDYELVNNIIKALTLWKKSLISKLIKFTNGEITTGGQVARIKKYCSDRGVDLDDLTAETVIKTIKTTESLQVKKILRFRQLLSKTSTAKFEKMILARCQDNTVKGNLYYYGAITGRYGGRGLQIQNLPRKKEKDPTKLIEAFNIGHKSVQKQFGFNVMEQASKLIRACLISPLGEDLIISDYSSIENRVLHWSAGDQKTLDEFAKGLDQYKTFASDRHNVAYDKVTSEQRYQGKTAILGLGYQMGGETYKTVCEGYGIKITLAEAKQTVKFYRSKYRKIVELWNDLNQAAIYCVETGRPSQNLKARFNSTRDYLFMKLPSNRCISYPKPRLIDARMPWGEVKPVVSFMGVNPYTKKWTRLNISPGRLTENLVQGIARDILVQGAINAERAGYCVRGSVHDEIISTRKEEEGLSIKEFDILICKMPAWADGLPLKAKGYKAKRYRKE